MYAVIRTGGKQYRVAPGDTLTIERTAHEDSKIEFPEEGFHLRTAYHAAHTNS